MLKTIYINTNVRIEHNWSMNTCLIIIVIIVYLWTFICEYGRWWLIWPKFI